MNKQLWNMYKESPEGKTCIELFKLETDNHRELLEGIIDFSKKCQPKMANIDELTQAETVKDYREFDTKSKIRLTIFVIL